MEDISCPRCKTTKYRNPSLKLMVNVCGHALCENCVEHLFFRGGNTCPECGIALRRTDFRVQVFENAMVEKEVDIRKKVLRDFNKKEDDFTTLREYNDYLEEIESIVFNLTNNIDVEDTKRKIEQYKKANKDIINKNRSKLSRDEELIEYYLEHEKEELDRHRREIVQMELEEKKKKKKNKESLIDDLMFSDAPASAILASHRQVRALEETSALPRQAVTQFSTGIKTGHQNVFMPIKKTEGVLYQYKPVVVETCGPLAPDQEAVTHTGYLKHIRGASDAERGGGYEAHIGCQRALQEALCGLFFSCDINPSPVPSTSSSDISEMEIS